MSYKEAADALAEGVGPAPKLVIQDGVMWDVSGHTGIPLLMQDEQGNPRQATWEELAKLPQDDPLVQQEMSRLRMETGTPYVPPLLEIPMEMSELEIDARYPKDLELPTAPPMDQRKYGEREEPQTTDEFEGHRRPRAMRNDPSVGKSIFRLMAMTKVVSTHNRKPKKKKR